MAIGLGIGLALIALGIAWEFVATHVEAPRASRPAVPAGR
jgi:hypothetical protein